MRQKTVNGSSDGSTFRENEGGGVAKGTHEDCCEFLVVVTIVISAGNINYSKTDN